MDQGKFDDAQVAYEAGQYREAAKKFIAAAGAGTAGNGAAFHMAGNALMRLRRFSDATTVYGQALRDDTYGKRGAVHANLGRAFAELGDYAKAEKAYEAAIAEPDYATPWKALQGAASALLERGRIDEAAVAFRKAAIDPGNPAPSKALVNLGLCFMGLGRPADAVEAYKAALGFDSYAGRGKALANMGIAYAQLGEYEEAIRAFEKSTEMHGHTLTGAAKDAYESALRMGRPAAETVDGWETGDIAMLAAGGAAPAGWGTDELAALASSSPLAAEGPQTGLDADHAAAELGFGDESAVKDFFAITEDEMRTRDREAKRARRDQERGRGAMVRTVVGWSLVVVLLGAAVGAGYALGFGWPTQDKTVEGMLAAYQSGAEYAEFWVAVPDKDVAKEMAKVPPVKGYTVDATERGARESAVSVTVTPEKGAALHYVVTLVREGVGWKVTGIENDWSSSGS